MAGECLPRSQPSPPGLRQCLQLVLWWDSRFENHNKGSCCSINTATLTGCDHHVTPFGSSVATTRGVRVAVLDRMAPAWSLLIPPGIGTADQQRAEHHFCPGDLRSRTQRRRRTQPARRAAPRGPQRQTHDFEVK